MGLMWTIIGFLTGVSILFYKKLNQKYNLTTLAWIGLLFGEFILLFGIAWSISSVLEGVPKSGSMGAIMFGGIGLIAIILTWRFQIKDSDKKSDVVESTTEDDDESESNSRREFLKKAPLITLGWQKVIGITAGVGAAATAAIAVKKSSGVILDDVPNAIAPDYKRMDNRKLIQTFAHSKKLQEKYPNRVSKWEKASLERMDDFKVEGSYKRYAEAPPKDEIGYSQLEYALAGAAWQTSLKSSPVTVAPNHGVNSWDQSKVNSTKYKFETKQDASDAIKTAAKLFGASKVGITKQDDRWDYDNLYDPIDEKDVSWGDFPFKAKTVIVCLIEIDRKSVV